jgi:hypothetical protein
MFHIYGYMTLSQLYQHRLSIDKNQTDKGTKHNYIDGYYNKKFSNLKNESINLLEIGVRWGNSISLWRNYFDKAMIYGIDRDRNSTSFEVCNSLSNVKIYKADAYCKETLNIFEDSFFDVIIDDGPHRIESQIYSAKEWTAKLKVGGFLAIEDIQNPNSTGLIQSAAPSNFESVIYDLRKDKNRYDDIIVEITRKS